MQQALLRIVHAPSPSPTPTHTHTLTRAQDGPPRLWWRRINPYHKEKAGHPREIAKVIAHIADNSTLWPSGSLVTVDGDSTISSEVFHRARFQPGLPELLGMPSPAELKEHLRDHRGGPYLQVKDEV